MFRDFKPEIKLFLLVASIAVVVSVSGILLLRSMTPMLVEPSLLTTDQSQTDLTADWNTYTNTKYNFTIKYPKKISGSNENWIYTMLPFGASGDNINFGIPSSRSIWSVYVWEVENPPNQTIEQLIKGTGQQFNDRKEARKNITINDKSALLVTVTTNSVQDWTYKIFYIEDKGKAYFIENGSTVIPEFDSFYSSFRFLN